MLSLSLPDFFGVYTMNYIAKVAAIAVVAVIVAKRLPVLKDYL